MNPLDAGVPGVHLICPSSFRRTKVAPTTITEGKKPNTPLTPAGVHVSTKAGCKADQPDIRVQESRSEPPSLRGISRQLAFVESAETPPTKGAFAYVVHFPSFPTSTGTPGS